MKKLQIITMFLAFLLPVFFVFHSLFVPGHLAFGDAPFFYPEGLKELIAEPLAWTNRGLNFGGINLMIWISPLTILYGTLGSLFKLGNDSTVRMIFYFPSVILAAVGPYLFSRYLGKSKLFGFFASLLYTLNTYFILVVDGGQVGYALAYGLFPFALLFLKKLVDKPSVKRTLWAIVFLFTCSVADPRVAIISVMAVAVWQILIIVFSRQFKLVKNFLWLIIAILSWIALSLYWIIPLFKNQDALAVGVTSPVGYKITSAILLFSPHWPDNIFGHINSPLPYFVFVPLIVFFPLIWSVFKRRKNFAEIIGMFLGYLVFALLTVSANLFSTIPFGFAFRDTSKFFVPTIFFASLLLGSAVEFVNKKMFTAVIYLYVIVLIWQAIFGKMNFVLSARSNEAGLNEIYRNLQQDNSFFRTLWIPEKHPLGLTLTNKPALDGMSLAESAPFAINTTGEDPYNFLNSDSYVSWMRVLGIKYILLSGDQRTFTKTTKELNNWNDIASLISNRNDLKKLNWESDIPVFEVENPLPRFFAVDKMYGVIGQPINDPNIPTLNYEDGLFDPNTMKSVSPDAYSVVFNGGDMDDLAMSFLQKYFQKPTENTSSQWAVYPHSSYLKYKYELLIRNVEFKDLDYSSGIAFSTNKGEKLEFSFSVPADGTYVFAQRVMSPVDGDTSLKWKFDEVKLTKGTYKKVIENSSGFSVLNVVALVPQDKFNQTKAQAETLAKNFQVDVKSIKSAKLTYQPVAADNWTTLKYKFANPGKKSWVIFSDNYNPMWKLTTGTLTYDSYPAYSMINAFYIDPNWRDLEISFQGQENVRWGIYFTVISAITIFIVYIFLVTKDEKSRRTNH